MPSESSTTPTFVRFTLLLIALMGAWGCVYEDWDVCTDDPDSEACHKLRCKRATGGGGWEACNACFAETDSWQLCATGSAVTSDASSPPQGTGDGSVPVPVMDGSAADAETLLSDSGSGEAGVEAGVLDAAVDAGPVGCGAHVECTSPVSSQCGASGTCVACDDNAHCDGVTDKSFCESGRCGVCDANDNGCSGLTDLCDLPGDRCVECLAHAGCETLALAKCGADGLCGACDHDSQCTDRGITTSCASGVCVECDAVEDCSSNADGRVLCDTSSNQCVRCVNSGDCSSADAAACGAAKECGPCVSGADCLGSVPGKPVCKQADGGTFAVNTCVQCDSDSDCGSVNRSRCVNNVCEACVVDGDCAGVSSGGIPRETCLAVDGGDNLCVDCALDSLDDSQLEDSKRERGCDGSVSCDPATLLCTATLKGSVGICEPCVSDSECAAEHRCIEMFFGAVSQGGRCMKVLDTGCANPYRAPSITTASFSAAPSAAYCGINQTGPDATSCEAVMALVDDTSCDNAGAPDASLCGGEGARCETVNGGQRRCTYSCSTGLVCPADANCDSDDYCGG